MADDTEVERQVQRLEEDDDSRSLIFWSSVPSNHHALDDADSGLTESMPAARGVTDDGTEVEESRVGASL